MSVTHYHFAGGDTGLWRVTVHKTLVGDPLVPVQGLTVLESPAAPMPAHWVLRGFTSNARYATRSEITALRATQEGLGRATARCAALIPIRKNAAWWALAQDKRRAIFEEQSRHTAIGLRHLPAIARQLHHSRDLGEPFDFLTWFEYSPADAGGFDDLLASLRATPEWRYVDRETEIRLERAGLQ